MPRLLPSILSLALAALAGVPARAEDRVRAASAAERPAQKPEGRAAAERPLSDEDAALVRELALLEKVDLLKNLELFEPAREKPRRKKGAP